MKKIALSLVALTALTGAAFANDRTEEGTVASRNVAAMSTETAGANVVTSYDTSYSSGLTEFQMKQRYGLEPDSGKNK